MPFLPQYHQSLLQVMLREEDLKTMINIHCGNMSQERMGQTTREREEAMCNGNEAFVTFLSKAHITVWNHICWLYRVVGLELVKLFLYKREKNWKRSPMLVWNMWLDNQENPRMKTPFHFWGKPPPNFHLRVLLLLGDKHQKEDHLVQWTRFSKKRDRKSLISPLPSSSIKTSYHLMLHVHLYLLRCAEL